MNHLSPEEFTKIFQERLALEMRLYRAKHKLRQQDLGAMISKTKNMAAIYETGRATPSVYTYYRLTKILGIDILKEMEKHEVSK